MESARSILRGIVEGHSGTLQVLVLEASPTPGEKKHYTAHFPTVDSIRKPLFLLNTNEIRAPHLCCQPLWGVIPDVRYNPKTHQKDWSNDAWEKRALCDLDRYSERSEEKPEYRILHTHSTNNRLYPNWFRPKIFNGNIYVLKFSKRSKDKTVIYDDILPNATPHAETELLEMLEHLMTEKGEWQEERSQSSGTGRP